MSYIENIIKRIRESFPEAEKVYTKGSCVRFAMILLEIFPHGEILYDGDHAVFCIDSKCYDITGEVQQNENHLPISEYGILGMYDLMQLTYDS